jgi:protein-disulfide isomerase
MPLRPPVNENDHIQGPLHAPVELVKYGDYQCPYCGQAYPIVKALQDRLGDKLKFVFRNFPLANIHSQAVMAAVSSEAAALQGKYWEMHDMLFINQKRLTRTAMFDYAAGIGLDIDRFSLDISNPVLEQKVEEHFESGIRSGVNATPAFFINGVKYEADWTGDGLLDFIQANYPEVG